MKKITMSAKKRTRESYDYLEPTTPPRKRPMRLFSSLVTPDKDKRPPTPGKTIVPDVYQYIDLTCLINEFTSIEKELVAHEVEGLARKLKQGPQIIEPQTKQSKIQSIQHYDGIWSQKSQKSVEVIDKVVVQPETRKSNAITPRSSQSGDKQSKPTHSTTKSVQSTTKDTQPKAESSQSSNKQSVPTQSTTKSVQPTTKATQPKATQPQARSKGSKTSTTTKVLSRAEQRAADLLEYQELLKVAYESIDSWSTPTQPLHQRPATLYSEESLFEVRRVPVNEQLAAIQSIL